MIKVPLKKSQTVIINLQIASQDDRQPRRAYITDQKKRDAVLKQSFNMDKVPEDLDAIIIGSGIGGLCTAALMAKSGKRVLVLEQHDQAGGCCHTFIDKV